MAYQARTLLPLVRGHQTWDLPPLPGIDIWWLSLVVITGDLFELTPQVLVATEYASYFNAAL